MRVCVCVTGVSGIIICFGSFNSIHIPVGDLTRAVQNSALVQKASYLHHGYPLMIHSQPLCCIGCTADFFLFTPSTPNLLKILIRKHPSKPHHK